MTTITLPLTCSGPEEPCVEATIIDIAPHLAHIATFAIDHRPFCKWVVSHVETGYMIASAEGLEDDEEVVMRLLSEAHAKLAAMTPEAFEAHCLAPVSDHVYFLTWCLR